MTEPETPVLIFCVVLCFGCGVFLGRTVAEICCGIYEAWKERGP